MNEIVETPKRYSLVERRPAASFAEERLHRKQRLAATFRLFSNDGKGIAAALGSKEGCDPAEPWTAHGWSDHRIPAVVGLDCGV
jgi:hypothetical protein